MQQLKKDSAGLGTATLRGLAAAQEAETAQSCRLESLSFHSGQTSLAVLGVESRIRDGGIWVEEGGGCARAGGGD